MTDDPDRPLEGEDIGTTHWEDARHWMSIYADLLEFKRGILDRIKRDLTKLEPIAQMAADADVRSIESQMEGYEKRLEIWSSTPTLVTDPSSLTWSSWPEGSLRVWLSLTRRGGSSTGRGDST